MPITENEAAGVLEGVSEEFAEAWAARDADADSENARDAVQMVREGTSPREALTLVGFRPYEDGAVRPSSSFRHIREYWVVQTARGPRAYYYSTLAGRTMPIKYAVAELLGATGQAEQVDKPAFLTSKLPF